MKKLSLFFWGVLVLLSTSAWENPKSKAYSVGEQLEYRIHYGIINAAEATISIDNQYISINNRPCYAVRVVGQTTGIFSWATKIRDTWTSYIDKDLGIPQLYESSNYEMGYRKSAKATFNHTLKSVHSEEFFKDSQEKKTVAVPQHIQDIVSGYFHCRTLSFENLPNKTIDLTIFFDGKIYPVKAKVKEKEVLSTKFGKINTVRVGILMPKNELFSENESIKIWVSDDNQKIPIRIEVKLNFGSLKMDLRAYKGLNLGFL